MISAALALLLAPAATKAALPAPAAQALRRGIIAADAGAWAVALRHFAQADAAAPLTPPVMANLGVAHARLGHHAAGAAWLLAYAAAAPRASDAAKAASEAQRLLAAAEARARALVEQAQEIQRDLHDAGVRTGVRGFATLAALQSLQGEDLLGAQASLSAVEDVTDRDAAWSDVAHRLAEHAEDRELARAAAQQIADPAQRATTLASLPSPGPAATGAAAWRELALSLSHDPEARDPARSLAAVDAAVIADVPLRLLQIAATLAGDTLRVRKMLARTEAGGS